MEEAFAKHIDNNPRWPMPYFAMASDALIKKFQDCIVKGMTISAPGFYGPQGRVLRMPLAKAYMVEKFESFRFGDYLLLTLRWKDLLLLVLRVIWDTRLVQFVVLL